MLGGGAPPPPLATDETGQPTEQYYSPTYGTTTDPVVAMNRARWEAKLADRSGRAYDRGIAKGEARDLRMGKASPEVLARANLAQGDMSLDRDWQGNVRMTRTMAPLAGMYGSQQAAAASGAEPMLLAQAGMRNAELANMQQQWLAAAPEERPAIEQRMQAVSSMPLDVPQGQTPDQFMQGMFGGGRQSQGGYSPTIVPSPGPTAPVPQPKPGPSVRDIDPTLSPAEIKAEAAAKKQEVEAAKKFDAVQAQVQAGRVPFDLVPDLGIVVSPYSGVSAEDAAKHIVSRWPSISYEEALRQVNERRKPEPIRPFGGMMRMW